MVDADLGPTGRSAVVVEETPWDLDATDPVEGHGERVTERDLRRSWWTATTVPRAPLRT